MSEPTTERGFVIDDTFSVPGWSWYNIDPEENAELRFLQAVPVYSRMRREETQLQSVLRAVKQPILRTNWRLDAEGCAPEVARHVALNLGLPINGEHIDTTTARRRSGRFSWQRHLKACLNHLDFGFAFFEQVYEYRDGLLWLRKLAERPQRTITGVSVARDGGLESISQGDVKIKVDRLVAYVNELEDGNWTGISLLRPSYKYWLLKDRMLRVQAITVERNGMGMPVYTAPPRNVDDDPDLQRANQREDVAEGLKIVKAARAGEYSGVALPNGATFDFKGVMGALPDASKPIRYYDEQMASSALAHFLNLGKQTGSWALGTTFADFFALSLQTVALYVADVATQHVVEDLVDLNYGENEPAPRIVFDEIGSQSPPTAEALQSLVQTKVIRPDDTLEDFMRRRYGLPAADASTRRGYQQMQTGEAE